MKFRALATTLVLGAAACLAAPAQAQSVDPCSVYLCMAGISGFGLSGGPACAPAMVFWHAVSPAGLAVWDAVPPVFIPPASATLRETYLSTCPGANPDVTAAIIEAWGWEP
jgi:hypothetical protein